MAAIVLVVATVFIIADQVIKYFIVQNLQPAGLIEVIKGFFSLKYIENTGVAFGFLENMRWIFIPLTILGCLAILWILFKYKSHSFWSYSAMTLLLAGGIGNLIDRIHYGYVIDYLYFHFFSYVFNLADCCVTVGAVLFVIAVLRADSAHTEKGKKHESEDPEPLESLEHTK